MSERFRLVKLNKLQSAEKEKDGGMRKGKETRRQGNHQQKHTSIQAIE